MLSRQAGDGSSADAETPFMLFILDGAERTFSPEHFWRVLFRLSPGESAVARLLIEGRKSRDIARQRGVAEATVRAQIKRIYEKLGVNTQGQAVAALLNASPVDINPPRDSGG